MTVAKRILFAVVIVAATGALAWIAAINLIDSSLMVVGRVVDESGAPQEGASVSLRVGNRILTDQTDQRGCFYIRTMTAFPKHECRLVITGQKNATDISLVAPGRHFLEITTHKGADSGSVRPIDSRTLADICK